MFPRTHMKSACIALQVMLVDRAGRRTLTLVGLGGMCVCAIAMTVGLKYQVCSVRFENFLEGYWHKQKAVINCAPPSAKQLD